MRYWRINIEFVPRDLWIGLFIGQEKSDLGPGITYRPYYLCIVPMFPIVFEWGWDSR